MVPAQYCFELRNIPAFRRWLAESVPGCDSRLFFPPMLTRDCENQSRILLHQWRYGKRLSRMTFHSFDAVFDGGFHHGQYLLHSFKGCWGMVRVAELQ